MPSGVLPARQADEALLNVLDAIYVRGLSGTALREATGLSKGALAGIRSRYRDSDLPCECVKAENKDGGMPSRWWAT